MRVPDRCRLAVWPLGLAVALSCAPDVAWAEEHEVVAEPVVAEPLAATGTAGMIEGWPMARPPVPAGWAPRFVAQAAARAVVAFRRVPIVDPGLPDVHALDVLPLPAAASAEGVALDDEEGDLPVPGPAPPAALQDVARLLAALVADPVRGLASSGFGWRNDPIRHRPRFHRGNDFRAVRGTPVYSAADGIVAYCGRAGGYGRMIDVRHAGGMVTRYAHLSSIDVSRGQHVTADTFIGRVGATGRATGPHLHFEVRLSGRAVDPHIAMRVGELMRNAPPDVAQMAALALRPELQATAVSVIDPPRVHGGRRDKRGKTHDRDRSRRRRPRVS